MILDFLAYLGTLTIGLALGLTGGGGSILTVPVLVYLWHVEPNLAIVYSLAVVGINSLIGAFSYARQKNIDYQTAFLFGIPSIFFIFLTRIYLLPLLPNFLQISESLTLSKERLLLFMFAFLMLWIGFKMLKKNNIIETEILKSKNYFSLLKNGIFVGILTGFLGAGGGFLIVPALIQKIKLPIKIAIGTSLLIISMNAFSGFIFALENLTLDFILLLKIMIVSLFGLVLSLKIAPKLAEEKIKFIFAIFIIFIAIFIILKEWMIML